MPSRYADRSATSTIRTGALVEPRPCRPRTETFQCYVPSAEGPLTTSQPTCPAAIERGRTYADRSLPLLRGNVNAPRPRAPRAPGLCAVLAFVGFVVILVGSSSNTLSESVILTLFLLSGVSFASRFLWARSRSRGLYTIPRDPAAFRPERLFLLMTAVLGIALGAHVLVGGPRDADLEAWLFSVAYLIPLVDIYGFAWKRLRAVSFSGRYSLAWPDAPHGRHSL